MRRACPATANAAAWAPGIRRKDPVRRGAPTSSTATATVKAIATKTQDVVARARHLPARPKFKRRSLPPKHATFTTAFSGKCGAGKGAIAEQRYSLVPSAAARNAAGLAAPAGAPGSARRSTRPRGATRVAGRPPDGSCWWSRMSSNSSAIASARRDDHAVDATARSSRHPLDAPSGGATGMAEKGIAIIGHADPRDRPGMAV